MILSCSTGLLTAVERLQTGGTGCLPGPPADPEGPGSLVGKPMPRLLLIDPLGYLDFVKLVAHSRLVLTDSGGLQEETTVLGVPCLTLRTTTERPATVEQGTNVLVGLDPAAIISCGIRALTTAPKPDRLPEFWDGQRG